MIGWLISFVLFVADAGGGRIAGPGKENGLTRGVEKAFAFSLPVSHETKREKSSLTR